jgi:hypothetical protein
MPRKTKRQKILARLHRLEQKGEDATSPNTSKRVEPEVRIENQQKISIKPEPSIAQPKETKVATQASVQDNRYNYSYVYKDLRKIIVLTVLALGGEVFLSLTASTSYAKLVLRALNLDF